MILIFHSFKYKFGHKLFDFFVSKNIDYLVIDPTDIYSVSIIQQSNFPSQIVLNNVTIDTNKISCIFSTSSNLNLRISLNQNESNEYDKLSSFFNREWFNINQFIGYLSLLSDKRVA